MVRGLDGQRRKDSEHSVALALPVSPEDLTSFLVFSWEMVVVVYERCEEQQAESHVLVPGNFNCFSDF